VSATKMGYTNVFIMAAGIMGWEDAKKPVEK
jgi:rhodanese-related sulfurtransferase